jgi:hypothetical protein
LIFRGPLGAGPSGVAHRRPGVVKFASSSADSAVVSGTVALDGEDASFDLTACEFASNDRRWMRKSGGTREESDGKSRFDECDVDEQIPVR